jgi:hypothetical protein
MSPAKARVAVSVCAPARLAAPFRVTPPRRVALTFSHRALHVPHDQAVRVIQELDADLGDLATRAGAANHLHHDRQLDRGVLRWRRTASARAQTSVEDGRVTRVPPASGAPDPAASAVACQRQRRARQTPLGFRATPPSDAAPQPERLTLHRAAQQLRRAVRPGPRRRRCPEAAARARPEVHGKRSMPAAWAAATGRRRALGRSATTRSGRAQPRRSPARSQRGVRRAGGTRPDVGLPKGAGPDARRAAPRRVSPSKTRAATHHGGRRAANRGSWCPSLADSLF